MPSFNDIESIYNVFSVNACTNWSLKIWENRTSAQNFRREKYASGQHIFFEEKESNITNIDFSHAIIYKGLEFG